MGALLRKFDRDRYSTVRDCYLLLLEHMDARRVAFDARPHSRRRLILRLLIDREFLVNEGTVTVITELGRLALAELLADYADRLLEHARRAQKQPNQWPVLPYEYPAPGETASQALEIMS